MSTRRDFLAASIGAAALSLSNDRRVFAQSAGEGMSILYVLIPLGLVLVIVGIWAFFWAVGSGQFDDLDTPAVRVVMDDDTKPDEEDRQ